MVYSDKTETYIYSDDPEWAAQMDRLKGQVTPAAAAPITAIVINKGPSYDFVSYNNSLSKPLAQLWLNSQLTEYKYNDRNQITDILQNHVTVIRNEYSATGQLLKISRYSNQSKKMVDQMVSTSTANSAPAN